MKGRVVTIFLTLAAVAALLNSVGNRSRKPFIWNASPSVPLGLYQLRPVGQLAVTDLVAVQPPEPLATYLSASGYLPYGIPMLKRVLALPGQTVCRRELTITVDDIPLGEARERDSRGRSLPVWQGCHRVIDGEVFLMNWQSEDSLDGRYFGVLPASAITGRAAPLWTTEQE